MIGNESYWCIDKCLIAFFVMQVRASNPEHQDQAKVQAFALHFASPVHNFSHRQLMQSNSAVSFNWSGYGSPLAMIFSGNECAETIRQADAFSSSPYFSNVPRTLSVQNSINFGCLYQLSTEVIVIPCLSASSFARPLYDLTENVEKCGASTIDTASVNAISMHFLYCVFNEWRNMF